jgi:hypothetical protein
MMLSDHFDVFKNGLKSLRLWLKGRLNLQDQVREDFVAPLMKKLLQQLILIVEIIHFYDQSINFLNFVNHTEMLLCLDGIEDSLTFLGKLRKFQKWSGAAGLSPTHDEVHHLSLAVLEAAAIWDGGSGNGALWSNF